MNACTMIDADSMVQVVHAFDRVKQKLDSSALFLAMSNQLNGYYDRATYADLALVVLVLDAPALVLEVHQVLRRLLQERW